MREHFGEEERRRDAVVQSWSKKSETEPWAGFTS